MQISTAKPKQNSQEIAFSTDIRKIEEEISDISPQRVKESSSQEQQSSLEIQKIETSFNQSNGYKSPTQNELSIANSKGPTQIINDYDSYEGIQEFSQSGKEEEMIVKNKEEEQPYRQDFGQNKD